MPAPTLFKADDGTVHEVLESKALTLEEIDERIAGSEAHTQHLRELRARVESLQQVDTPAATSDVPAPEVPAPAAPEQPAVPGGVELTVTPAEPATLAANADQGQAPAVPAVDGPAADTAAVNNGQVDPAAATNPTPPVDVPAVPEQPIIGA